MNYKKLNLDVSGALTLSRSTLPSPIHTLTPGDGIKRKDERMGDLIALTFDDGPDPVHTPKILDVLEQHAVKATFFVLGAAAEKYPHLLTRMVSAGHTIGNHTYSHWHPWIMTAERAIDEVRRTTGVIKDITGAAPRWFRPPFGRLRTVMRRQAQEEKMATVLWSQSIIDWGPLGNEAGIRNRLEQIKPNDIVLMHDGKREHNRPEITLQCLPHFLKSLPGKSIIPCGLDDFSPIINC